MLSKSLYGSRSDRVCNVSLIKLGSMKDLLPGLSCQLITFCSSFRCEQTCDGFNVSFQSWILSIADTWKKTRRVIRFGLFLCFCTSKCSRILSVGCMTKSPNSWKSRKVNVWSNTLLSGESSFPGRIAVRAAVMVFSLSHLKSCSPGGRLSPPVLKRCSSKISTAKSIEL